MTRTRRGAIPTIADAAAEFAIGSAGVHHDASGGVPSFRLLHIASGDARFGDRRFSRLITNHQSGASSWFADRKYSVQSAERRHRDSAPAASASS
jgi:hypothetical protein